MFALRNMWTRVQRFLPSAKNFTQHLLLNTIKVFATYIFKSLDRHWWLAESYNREAVFLVYNFKRHKINSLHFHCRGEGTSSSSLHIKILIIKLKLPTWLL